MAESKFKIGDLVKHKAEHAMLTPPLMTVHGYIVETVDDYLIACKYYDGVDRKFIVENFREEELAKYN